jgi:hypothetical protein
MRSRTPFLWRAHHLCAANRHLFSWGPGRISCWRWVELVGQVGLPLEPVGEVKTGFFHGREVGLHRQVAIWECASFVVFAVGVGSKRKCMVVLGCRDTRWPPRGIEVLMEHLAWIDVACVAVKCRCRELSRTCRGDCAEDRVTVWVEDVLRLH